MALAHKRGAAASHITFHDKNFYLLQAVCQMHTALVKFSLVKLSLV